MEVKIELESGYEQAIKGMSYSFRDRALPLDEWWDGQKGKAEKRAAKLANMSGGHNDFLKQIILWIDIEAPRYWWSEMDTYHFVWKNSESTMHTISKRYTTADDFEFGDENTAAFLNEYIDKYRRKIICIDELKSKIPDGYKQRRMCTTNYMALRNILSQRVDHRLAAWHEIFCKQVYQQCQHPEFLIGG